VKKKILHILLPDKFTIPFIRLINKEFNQEEHLFLCCSEPGKDLLQSASNIQFLLNPYRKNFYRNSRIFYKSIKEASKIILHGTPILYAFLLAPRYLRKTYWIIQGDELADELLGRKKTIFKCFHNYLNSKLLKQVYGHISHIEGESHLANRFYNSSAKFFFSPAYLSNVVDLSEYHDNINPTKNEVTKILVGNSTSPTNNHISIFEMLIPYKEENFIIYCPLSYGIHVRHRDNVIKAGKALFGEKFVPLLDFMEIDEYMEFLKKIDIAIFNHYRQEAMGITLQLLSMSKIVFMNCTTTSYMSLIERGVNVFDNNLVKQGQLFIKRDTSKNPLLIYSYYNYSSLVESWSKIFND
jgi:dTDP-N-acetylfucosamine:lipid II N-acetylfucosaminyltransferase